MRAFAVAAASPALMSLAPMTTAAAPAAANAAAPIFANLPSAPPNFARRDSESFSALRSGPALPEMVTEISATVGVYLGV